MKTLSSFNHRWKRFLFSNSCMSFLDGYGWNDGGCYILAAAVNIWSTNTRIARPVGVFTLGHNQLMHAAIEIVPAGRLFDADGLMTPAQMLELKMPGEYVNKPCSIKTLDPSATFPEIPSCPQTSRTLSGLFIKRFGPFNQFISEVRFD